MKNVLHGPKCTKWLFPVISPQNKNLFQLRKVNLLIGLFSQRKLIDYLMIPFQSNCWKMPDSCQVYVGFLPNNATMEDVEHFFRGYGKVKSINLKPGYGFVVFEDRRDAEDAVKVCFSWVSITNFFFCNKFFSRILMGSACVEKKLTSKSLKVRATKHVTVGVMDDLSWETHAVSERPAADHAHTIDEVVPETEG